MQQHCCRICTEENIELAFISRSDMSKNNWQVFGEGVSRLKLGIQEEPIFKQCEFIEIEDNLPIDHLGPGQLGQGEVSCHHMTWDESEKRFKGKDVVVASLFVTVNDEVRQKSMLCVAIPAHLRQIGRAHV